MADCVSSHGVAEEKQYNFLAATEDTSLVDEIARLKQELELLKNANPFRMAELALEIQIERLRVIEITAARDAALQRLSDTYISIRQKNEIIERMLQEREGKGVSFPTHLTFSGGQTEVDQLKAHICCLEATNEELLRQLQETTSVTKSVDPPPSYEVNATKPTCVDAGMQTEDLDSSHSVNDCFVDREIKYLSPNTDDPIELVKARNAVLASIPLPDNPPDATLSAIVIPPPFTLHEFLSGAPGALRNLILHNVTTSWCPEREEHGYMYTPIFKCSTNPRIATAHRWTAVDVIGRMNKPTDCFYNKEGVWYYAGSYKAFRLDDLSTKEWAQLSSETMSAIVKETISGRKNSSPQNTYETSQLYTSGALKVACVGLQCVGFNQEVYKSIIEHSIRFSESKWKSLATASANVLAAAASVASAAGVTGVAANGGGSGGGSPVNTPLSQSQSGGTMKTQTQTPILARHHLPRTPSYLSSTNSSASPSAQLGSALGSRSTSLVNFGNLGALGTPPLAATAMGLGLGSSAWNMSASANANATGVGMTMTTPPSSLDGKAGLRENRALGLEGSENLADAGKR